VLKNLLTRSVIPKVSGQVVKSVPVAATSAKATGGSILSGLLPALAFTGIIEGGYQIFRTIRGEQNIGMTGVPPLDIFNLITGRVKFFGIEPIPTLLFPQFGRAAAGQPPMEVGTNLTAWPLISGTLSRLDLPSAEPKSPQEIVPGYLGPKSIKTPFKRPKSSQQIIPGYSRK